MKINIRNNTKDIILFSGKYEYLEGGLGKDNNPGVHISASANRENCEIFFYFENKEEVKEFVEDISEALLK